MYYIRDYLFHISVRYEKELVLILILCTEIQMTNIVKKHCEINFSHTDFSVENNYYNFVFGMVTDMMPMIQKFRKSVQKWGKLSKST